MSEEEIKAALRLEFVPASEDCLGIIQDARIRLMWHDEVLDEAHIDLDSRVVLV